MNNNQISKSEFKTKALEFFAKLKHPVKVLL
jgi:hypothetical protein